MTGTDCGLFRHNQSRSYLNHLVILLGARGGAVGRGTALQAGRSLVRFPMVS